MFFFCCAPLSAATFRRGQSKKNTTQGAFFCSGPGERQGKEKAPCRHGARAKKETPPRVCFFAQAPKKGRGRRSPVGRRHRARAKKKTPWVVFFFLLRPRGKAGEGEAQLGAGTGPEQKKTPWVVFFFCCGPARTLTHSLRAWAAMPPLAGVVFFFLLRPRPDRGGVFFLLWPRPDAHSLTVGWGDFGKARVVFFFAAAPPGLFRQ